MTSKFAGAYDLASRARTSGKSEDDVMEAADKLYFQSQGVKFSLDHAWRFLHNDQKWCSLNTEKTDNAAYSSSSNADCLVEEQSRERPMGAKASKAKKKRSDQAKSMEGEKDECVKDLEEMWVIKERDWAFKERISKHKLLSNLLAKTEPYQM